MRPLILRSFSRAALGVTRLGALVGALGALGLTLACASSPGPSRTDTTPAPWPGSTASRAQEECVVPNSLQDQEHLSRPEEFPSWRLVTIGVNRNVLMRCFDRASKPSPTGTDGEPADPVEATAPPTR